MGYAEELTNAFEPIRITLRIITGRGDRCCRRRFMLIQQIDKLRNSQSRNRSLLGNKIVHNFTLLNSTMRTAYSAKSNLIMQGYELNCCTSRVQRVQNKGYKGYKMKEKRYFIASLINYSFSILEIISFNTCVSFSFAGCVCSLLCRNCSALYPVKVLIVSANPVSGICFITPFCRSIVNKNHVPSRVIGFLHISSSEVIVVMLSLATSDIIYLVAGSTLSMSIGICVLKTFRVLRSR